MTQIVMNPRPIQNMGASSIQLTAEQILKDADIHKQQTVKAPLTYIMDEKELLVYTQEKRKFFEDKLRRQRYNLSVWVRYAQWEQNLKEYARARSIYERSLEIDYTNKSLWLQYAEMEMKNKFINHARNVWERATYYLPREDQFWFKYAYMEELIGDYNKARDVFTRWMEWMPGEKAWMSFIKFQERMGEPERAKKILYKYLECFPTLNAYLKVAKAEIKSKNKQAARGIYQRIITELGSEALEEAYFIDFSKFQIRQREYDRARGIFQFGLKHIPKEKSKSLYEQYLNFEKQFGNKKEIDEVILGERRNVYKELISKNQRNYDAWLNLIFLEESFKNVDKIREVYEAAVKIVPPVQQKRFWRRYMYIWLNYAVFEEEIAQDLAKAEQIYQRAIKVIPNKKFTFGKLWINFSQFYIRCGDIAKARKNYGRSIGLFPKQKVFRTYIQMQFNLGEYERVRSIYRKYCQIFANLPGPWVQFASFELSLTETERACQILQIATQLNVQGLPDIQEFLASEANQEQQQPEDEQNYRKNDDDE